MSYLKVAPKGTIKVDLVAGYLAGVTTIHVDGFTHATGLVKADSVFTLGTGIVEYTITTDAHVISSECDLVFSPALAASLANDTQLVFQTDMKDAVLNEFDLTYPVDYLALADEEILTQAERLGVYEESEIYLPLHSTIKKYALNWLCAEVACDKMGVNNLDTPDMEKYHIKYDVYRKKADEKLKQLNYEMFINEVASITDTVVTQGTLYRG